MKTKLSLLGLVFGLGCGVAGCQVVSGLNDLEVVATPATSTDDDDDDTEGTSQESSETPPDASVGSACTKPTGLECSPANNCGCEGGEVCALVESEGDVTVACQNPGSKDSGDSCELGDCGPNLLCIERTCVPACRFDSDCESDHSECQDVLRPNGQALKGIRFCTANCDLAEPEAPSAGLDACAEEQTCILTSTGSVCSNDVGAGKQGEVCESQADCTVGFTCHNQECKQWCKLDAPDCGVGLNCEEASVGNSATENLGVCGGGCEATIPAGDECLIAPDCGCPEGETCRAMEDGKRACTPQGTALDQSGCDDNGDCGAGLACIGALCRPYCDPASATCSDGSQCVQVNYEDEAVTGVGACLGLCDPVHPETDDEVYTPCGDGAECVAGFLETDYPISFCLDEREEPGPRVGACTSDGSCAETATCIVDRCFPYCRSSSDCEGVTQVGDCLLADFYVRGAPDDVLGLCCSPTPVDGSECAYDLNCGCGAGETCRSSVLGTGVTECSSIGPAGYQEACDDDTECGSGLSCIGGLCSPHCSGSCETNEGECIPVRTDTEPPEDIPFAFICAGRCDPIDLTRSDLDVKPCGAGADCVPGWADSTDPLYAASFCLPDTGDGDDDDTCSYDSDCAAGYGCTSVVCDAQTCSGFCAQYCEDNGDCQPGMACNLEDARVGAPGSTIGFCVGVAPSSSE